MNLLEIVERVMPEQEALSLMKEVLGCDGNVVKREGERALFIAAGKGKLALVRHLVEYAATNLRTRDEDGSSVLHMGVRSGNVALVKYLTERTGLDPMEYNRCGVTPYDLAHSLEDKEIEGYFSKVCGTFYENTYHNPVLTGFHPDPSVVRVGEDYYMVNSSFCYFPCIPISHSTDLIHWREIGHAITNPHYAHLEELEGGRGYWAPDISYGDGLFYITATYRANESEKRRRKQMIVTSAKPEGPYGEPVFLEEDGIDPSIFHDDDGKSYMLLNRGARIFEISRDGTEMLSEPELLWYGDYMVTPEGPHLIKKGGYYYLFLAEGGTGRGHRVTVARSVTLRGPYESCPYNPILTQGNQDNLMQCCGHGMPVETQCGEWYLVYLCLRIPDGKHGVLGRETAVDPIVWSPDGWPIVNNGRGPGNQQMLPALPKAEYKEEKAIRDGYILPEDGRWLVHRHSKRASGSIPGGAVTILGNGADLCDLSCDSMLLKRQEDFRFTAYTYLTPHGLREGEDLGLTAYYDENSYIKLGVCRLKDGYGVGVWEYVDDRYRLVRVVNIYGDERHIGLKFDTDYMKRRCFYQDGGEWKLLWNFADTSYLSSEGLEKGKRFTGAMVGMYVNGGCSGSFHAFYYHPKR